jgi:uncharacterized protein
MMSSLTPESILHEQLLLESAEYRKIAVEHQMYDDQLEDLSRKHFLSEEEKLKEKTLKKKKLILKDQMFFMVQIYRKRLEPESQ